MSDDDALTRRRFLIASATAAAVTGCASATYPECALWGTTPVDTGITADSLAVGELRRVNLNGQSVYLGRDATGYYAMSALCTHQQCILPSHVDAMDQINCPCHASVYSVTGVLLQAATGGPPAPQGNLPMYCVSFVGSSATIALDLHSVATDRTERATPP